MKMENQGSAVPPSRPPPPAVASAPPAYGDTPVGTYPAGQPGMPNQNDCPPPYAPSAYQMGHPPPGGYAQQGNAQGPPPQGFHLSSPPSLYPDLSQLPEPEGGTVPLVLHGQCILVTHKSFHPSEDLFSAPLELPPSYEESLSPSHHPNLHANIATAHTRLSCREPLTLHEASFTRANANNPSAFGNAAYFTDKNSKPGDFVGEAKEMRSEYLPIDVLSAKGLHPGFDPAVVGPGVQTSPTAASRVPVRPAPCPPVNIPSAPASALEEPPKWWATLKEGEAPPDCVISWKGAKGLKIYFIQDEGHIVSPTNPLEMIVFKKIKGKSDVVEDSLLGMIEVMGCWRLRLHGNNSFCLHTYNDIYVFLDDSTCPSKSGRIVILELPHDVSKTMRSDLLALLQEMTDLREEQEGVVGKITTNVGSVYEDITKKINLAVKDVAPGAHKSTKWIRKGTGSLVRMGGNLVSKGLHIVADHIPASQPEQEEESPLHSILLEGLRKFQKDLESKMITYV